VSNWIKLALPLGLGVVAGVINWSVTMTKIKPIACVALAADLKAGEKLSENVLLPMELSGNVPRLTHTVVPWQERAILYGRAVPRTMQAGDLIFWRDAAPAPKELLVCKGEVPLSVSLRGMTVVPDFLHVGQQVGFLVATNPGRKRREPVASDPEPEPECKSTRYVGPFRILAVGRRTSPSADGSERTSEDTRVLTVAAKLLPNTGQLAAMADRLVAALNGLRDEQAVGVILHYDAAVSR
jgi:hypothetical protein